MNRFYRPDQFTRRRSFSLGRWVNIVLAACACLLVAYGLVWLAFAL